MPTYKISEYFGLSHSVIVRLAENVYELKIPICKEVSEQELIYWIKYLDEIGKYHNE